jgi:hypothetical protein
VGAKLQDGGRDVEDDSAGDDHGKSVSEDSLVVHDEM